MKNTTSKRTYLDDVDDMIIAMLTDKPIPEHCSSYQLAFEEGGVFEIRERGKDEPSIVMKK